MWTLGPAHDELPGLCIAEFAPGPKTNLWVYATIGAWEARERPRLEFVITAPERDQRHVELLTMTTCYHGQHQLGLGHTFPIGEPWLPGSACEYLLVSLPYAFGQKLELYQLSDCQLRVLWLLPITAAEREFNTQVGLEALEEKFDECGLEYWDPGRASVV